MGLKCQIRSTREGWSRQRQVIILRRRLKGDLAVAGRGDEGQLALGFVEIGPGADVYEYGVLVTSLEEEVLALAQLYRDRGDSENPFDELKNQWVRRDNQSEKAAAIRMRMPLVA
jgi:hypothetical protein